MIAFWDENIFLFTFGIIIILVIAINSFNWRPWIIKNSQVIAIGFALVQLGAFLAFVITNFLRGLWFFGLLQDLCPTISFISIMVFIWHKDNLYKAFMPWLIIGATVTMLGGHANIFTDGLSWITYIQHTSMMLQGICAYLWISKYTKKQIMQILIFPVLLISWVFIVGFIPWQITKDPRWVVFSTALFEPAIGPTTVLSETGEVINVDSWVVLNELGMPYPLPTIVFYTIAVTAAILIALTKNYSKLLWIKLKNTVSSWSKKTKKIQIKEVKNSELKSST